MNKIAHWWRFRQREILILLGVLFVLAILILLALDNASLRRKVEDLTSQIEDREDTLTAIDKSTTEISRQINCIATYFAQREKDEVRITDLKECKLKRDSQEVTKPSSSSPQSQPSTTSEPKSSSKPKPKPKSNDKPPTPRKEPNTLEERGVERCIMQLLPGDEPPCSL